MLAGCHAFTVIFPKSLSRPGRTRHHYDEVDRVTDVDRGSVTRVRVELNQADPPVTRVVLDLEGSTSSFLEQGATERELRITVVTASSVASTRTPRDPVGPTDRYEA